MPKAVEQARSMNEFDAACFLAACLLAESPIAEWVAVANPVVIVDEAQDLDEHRFAMLRGLDAKCQTLAAADDFQCLDKIKITGVGNVIRWLRAAREVVELSDVVRTSQSGLLQVARAIREGRGVLEQLGPPTGAPIEVRAAKGFRLREIPAKNDGMVAWSIGFELKQMHGDVAILTADGGHPLLRKALEKVHTTEFNLNREKGIKFGPFPLAWEIGDAERASKMIRALRLSETMSCQEAALALSVLASEAEIVATMERVTRLRRIEGRLTISSAEVEALIRTVTRDISRHGPRVSTTTAMTIHAAKNQEFENVIVLWPHTTPGEPDQARRLLYNAITRARRHCSVVVVGLDRLKSPPFST